MVWTTAYVPPQPLLRTKKDVQVLIFPGSMDAEEANQRAEARRKEGKIKSCQPEIRKGRYGRK